MERLQQDHLGIVATTTGAAVLLVVLFWNIYSRTSLQHHNDVSSPEQLKQRVAAAAWSRSTQRHDEPKEVQKKKKKTTNVWKECPRIETAEQATVPRRVDQQEEKMKIASLAAEYRKGNVGDDDEKRDYYEETETILDQTRHEHHDARLPSCPKEHKKHDAAVTIRQATLGDQVAWNEERASRLQFGGFSIYGHAPPCSVDGCCSVVRRGRGGDTESSFTSLSQRPTGFDAIHGVSEICSLPGSDHARNLLQQLCHEFEPVVRSRGWSVGKVVEMCCCNSNNTKPPNVVGYCVASGDGRTAHSIHIRLRPPGSCQRFHFYPYNNLVQTMAHELAHVKIPAHNDAFFKLMAELEAERVQWLANGNGSSIEANHFSMTISSGRRLGGTASSSSGSLSPVIGSQDLKRMVAKAAVKRQAHTKQE